MSCISNNQDIGKNNKSETYGPFAQQLHADKGEQASSGGNPQPTIIIKVYSIDEYAMNESPARGPRWRRHGHAIGIPALKEPV